MKGRVSPLLEKLLNDPKGREQLKTHLLTGTDGKIVTSTKTYEVRIDVTSSSAKAKGE